MIMNKKRILKWMLQGVVWIATAALTALGTVSCVS